MITFDDMRAGSGATISILSSWRESVTILAGTCRFFTSMAERQHDLRHGANIYPRM